LQITSPDHYMDSFSYVHYQIILYFTSSSSNTVDDLANHQVMA